MKSLNKILYDDPEGQAYDEVLGLVHQEASRKVHQEGIRDWADPTTESVISFAIREPILFDMGEILKKDVDS